MRNPFKSLIISKRIQILFVLILLFVISFFIQIYQIDKPVLTNIEGYWIFQASLPISDQINFMKSQHISPTLYPLFLRNWYELKSKIRNQFKFKTDDTTTMNFEYIEMRSPWNDKTWEWDIYPEIVWGRLFSILWGMLNLLFIYFIARQTTNHWIAYITLILVIFAPNQIFLSREISPGSLQLFTILGSVFFIIISLKQQLIGPMSGKYILSLIGYFIFTTLAMTIHMTSIIFNILIICIITIYLLFRFQRTNRWYTMIITQILLLFATAIWLYYWNFPKFIQSPEISLFLPKNWKEILLSIGYTRIPLSLPVYIEWFSIIYLLISLFIGLVITLYIKMKKLTDIDSTHHYQIIILFIISFGLLILFHFIQPIIGWLSPADWAIYTTPLICLLISMGYYSISIWNWRYRLLVFQLILYCTFSTSLFLSQSETQWKDTALWLNRNISKEDYVIFLPDNQSFSFDYYFQQPQLRFILKREKDIYELLDKIENNNQRVWLVKLSNDYLPFEGSSLIQGLNYYFEDKYYQYVDMQSGLLTITEYKNKQKFDSLFIPIEMKIKPKID